MENAPIDAISEINNGDGGSITLQRPFAFDEAVNVMLETSQETQSYVKVMHDGFKSMTTQIINAITGLSNKNIPRKCSLPKNIFLLS